MKSVNLYFIDNLKKFYNYIGFIKSKTDLKIILPFIISIVLLLTIVAYFSFNDIATTTGENARNSAFGLTRQTAKNIHTVYSEIDRQALRISRDERIVSLLELYNQMNREKQLESSNTIHKILVEYASLNTEFADIYIFTEHGDIFYSGVGVSDGFMKSYAVQKYKEANKKSLWIDTYTSDNKTTKFVSPKVITLMKAMYISSSLRSVGTLMININEKHLYGLLQDVDLGYEGKMMVLGGNSNIVMDPVNMERNSTVLKDKYIKEAYENESGYYYTAIEGTEYLITNYEVERTGWKLIGIIPLNNITKGIRQASIRIILIVVICFIVGLALSIALSLRTTQLMEKTIKHRTEQLQDALETIRKTQDQLIQSEKMASLGILVSGVAHEINTPIGVSVTAASHLDSKTKEFIELVKGKSIKASDISKVTLTMTETTEVLLINLRRASDLIKSFKQIAVDQSYEDKRYFNVKQYISEVILSLKPTLKKTRLEININCSENMNVKTYAGSFAQVITNLIMNSYIHGFDQTDEGVVNITLFSNNNFLEFEYTDNGKGIDKDVLKKIYDPFFTTRRGQGGTGLGMYIVYNIVSQKLGGSISCESEMGKGTKFLVKFPVEIKSF
ncbi:MAG: sensor histidine kinase [Clostridia bacterium]|nr:sensor histidine kinase [Clostridia bacterium]